MFRNPLNILPEGLEVVGCKVPVCCLPRLKVFVRNTSDHDIVLRKRQVVADVFSVHSEYNVKEVLSTLATDKSCEKSDDDDDNVFSCGVQCTKDDVPEERNQTTDFPFRFGDNSLKEWCDSFKTKLQSFGDVFIWSALDIGKVDAGVEFDI